jgi:hypothetical protein
MKYETPELTALTPALNAIQTPKGPVIPNIDGLRVELGVGAYEDWE